MPSRAHPKNRRTRHRDVNSRNARNQEVATLLSELREVRRATARASPGTALEPQLRAPSERSDCPARPAAPLSQRDVPVRDSAFERRIS